MLTDTAQPIATETNKPKRAAGQCCPLMGGKDVSKVCHTCDFYQRVRGVVPMKDNPSQRQDRWVDNWACTIAHSHLFQANIDKRTLEVGVELNMLRNATAEANANLGVLMKALGSAINTMIEIVASTRLPQDQPSVLLPASQVTPALTNGHAYEPEPVKQLEFGV
jgi:hypothetical protein